MDYPEVRKLEVMAAALASMTSSKPDLAHQSTMGHNVCGAADVPKAALRGRPEIAAAVTA